MAPFKFGKKNGKDKSVVGRATPGPEPVGAAGGPTGGSSKAAGREARRQETPWDRVKLVQTPFPRYRHVASAYASDTNEVIVIGGLHDQSVYGDTWILRAQENGKRFSARTIEITETTPPPRVGHAATLCGNAFVIFGGDTHKTNSEGLMDDDVYLLNVNSHKWTIPHPVGPRPLGRYGHKISIIATSQMKTKLYVFGGQFDDTYFNDLAVYDLSSFRRPDSHWVFVKPASFAPPPLTNHTMVSYDYKLWVFGGDTPQGLINELFVYDPAVNDWSVVETTGSKPPPLQEHAAVLYRDLMCVVGGKDDQDNYSQDVYFMNLKTFRWFKLPHFQDFVPSPRSGHSVTLLANRKLLIMGGDKFDYARPGETDLTAADHDMRAGTILYTLDLTDLEEYCPGVFEMSGVSPPRRTPSQSTSASSKNTAMTTPMMPRSSFTPATSPAQIKPNGVVNILSPHQEGKKRQPADSQFYGEQQYKATPQQKTPPLKQNAKPAQQQHRSPHQTVTQGFQKTADSQVHKQPQKKYAAQQNSKDHEDATDTTHSTEPLSTAESSQLPSDVTTASTEPADISTSQAHSRPGQKPKSPVPNVIDNERSPRVASMQYSHPLEKGKNKRHSQIIDEYDGELGVAVVGNSPGKDEVRRQSVDESKSDGWTQQPRTFAELAELPGSFTPKQLSDVERSPVLERSIPGAAVASGRAKDKQENNDHSSNKETPTGATHHQAAPTEFVTPSSADDPAVGLARSPKEVGRSATYEVGQRSQPKEGASPGEVVRSASVKDTPRSVADDNLSHAKLKHGERANNPFLQDTRFDSPSKGSSASAEDVLEKPAGIDAVELNGRSSVAKKNSESIFSKRGTPDGHVSNEFVQQLFEELRELKLQTERSAAEASNRIRLLEDENLKLRQPGHGTSHRGISGASEDASYSKLQTEVEILKADKAVYVDRVAELQEFLESNILDAERLNRIIESQSKIIESYSDQESYKEKCEQLQKQLNALKEENEELKSKNISQMNKLQQDISNHSQAMRDMLKHWKSQGLSDSAEGGAEGVRNLQHHQSIINKLSAQLDAAEKEKSDLNHLHHELLRNYESLQQDYKALNDELVSKQNEVSYLEQNYKSSLSSVNNASKALELSQRELGKLKHENTKLKEQLEDLTLSPSIDGRSKFANTLTDDPLGSLNDAHYNLRIKDLKAELFIVRQERDSLKDELLQLKKRLFTMDD
ncbi:AaceriADL149Wp [[Ashbya] aceris (nom. inval.)]|nr:AaceriADL149Wp [[Ashbya] aceris (nom. inval.)]